MKKFLSYFLSAFLVFGFVGCSPSNEGADESMPSENEGDAYASDVFDDYSDLIGAVDSASDSVPEEEISKILVLEASAGESALFVETVASENYQIDCMQMDDEEVPTTAEALSTYDEVVLYNVSNADMPQGFADILYAYVNEMGGGLFTVGGNKQDANGEVIYNEYNCVVSNAYNCEDMRGSKYGELLPVEAIDYTSSVATVLIIDNSSSMDMGGSGSEQTYLSGAKSGAKAILDSMTERDYCGIMTLSGGAEVASIMSMNRISILKRAIDTIQTENGNGSLEVAFSRASKALQTLQTVERRHVIVVTDGLMAEDLDVYKKTIERYSSDAEKPVTYSFIVVGDNASSSDKRDLREAAALGGGRFLDVEKVEDLSAAMRDEANAYEIRKVEYREFVPQVAKRDIFNGLTDEQMPKLTGFYGVKLKEGAEEILKGEYTPIYAQWTFGKGKVGSFACDLNGVWSSDFMAQETGKQILINIVVSLLRK